MVEEKQNEKQEIKESKGIEEKLAEQAKPEIKKEKETKEEKKKKRKIQEGKKKTEAVVKGRDLPISTKHAIAICRFIRGKTIDKSISELSQILQFKKALPMRGELPHRKGKIMSGRYPIKAIQHFIRLLKQLAANATVNGLELEKARVECKADRAARPHKRFGQERFKRTHVELKLKMPRQNKKQNKEK